ncbi:MAG TPA: methylmalonyl Co-A mutase-associated GTPase MeaB [Acidobacteriaceae bacterium]|nr:methylmalonyl Co-A mutase-associated GTPase MeaB [Acidobacteriaceae bacterium]
MVDLVARLLQGEPRALARAISLVENAAPQAATILSACFPRAGHALRIGITGAPGAGKSTLVERLARHFLAAGRRVGVIAVDPTSPFTGGAILGDRIRFQERHNHPAFYARSMATRGSLGGLALATADIALLIEAGGKDLLLIETVGVGQDEIEIARLADVTLVVLVPGMGDDVQSLKAGVMEIADIFVVNKSDRDGADRVEQEIRALQSLAPPSRTSSVSGRALSGAPGEASALKGHGFSRAGEAAKEKGASAPDVIWTPPVVRTIATTGDGIDALAASIAEMDSWLRTANRLAERRTRHWQRRLDAMLRAELMRRARHNGLTEEELHRHAAQVASGAEDPWQLVPRLARMILTLDAPT